MRLHRIQLTTQHYMAAIALIAILIYTLTAVGPDFIRRWAACRNAAQAYLGSARYHARYANEGNPDDPNPDPEYQIRYRMRHREEEAYCLKRSGELRRALYLPWELYWLDPSEVTW